MTSGISAGTPTPVLLTILHVGFEIFAVGTILTAAVFVALVGTETLIQGAAARRDRREEVLLSYVSCAHGRGTYRSPRLDSGSAGASDHG